MNEIYKILFTSALLSVVVAQVIGPGTYCLGNCAHCDAKSLYSCTGTNPCEEEFYDSEGKGVCQIMPSL